MNFFQVFGLLLFCHALADFPLQTEFMARAKNCKTPVPGIPWACALSAHALVHAGLVGLVTGSFIIGLCEFLSHWYTDYLKCAGKIGFNRDQATHLACKVMWAFLFIIWK